MPVDQQDEWAAADRLYFSARSMILVTTATSQPERQVTPPELKTASSEHRPHREERKANTKGKSPLE
jgi:hypothetical protein